MQAFPAPEVEKNTQKKREREKTREEELEENSHTLDGREIRLDCDLRSRLAMFLANFRDALNEHGSLERRPPRFPREREIVKPGTA